MTKSGNRHKKNKTNPRAFQNDAIKKCVTKYIKTGNKHPKERYFTSFSSLLMLFPNFITIFATSTDVYNAAFASHYYTKAIDTSDKTAPQKNKTDYNPMNKIIALIIACTFCIAS